MRLPQASDVSFDVSELHTPDSTLGVELQPQIDLLYSSRAPWVVRGFEALLRIRQGDRVVPTPEYLAAREKCGTLPQLIFEVLPLVAAAVAQLRQADILLPVAVNAAPAELTQALPDFYAHTLRQYSLNPTDIPIELTEGAYPNTEQRVVLRQLHRLGAPIHLDDVGSGCADLTIIRELADLVSLLKLDRSLTLAVAQNSADAAAWVRSVARQHRCRLLAEGPEDAATLDALRRLGVRYAQSYYTGRPLPVEALLLQCRRENRLVILDKGPS